MKAITGRRIFSDGNGEIQSRSNVDAKGGCAPRARCRCSTICSIRNWVSSDFGQLICIMCSHETGLGGCQVPAPIRQKESKRRVGTAHADIRSVFHFEARNEGAASETPKP